ncbi:MAG: Holliday junction branch migration protein RuvA [Planctomycetes bacterium]|nr:Holliday junction branch migration protein RuvA [Planctomycetota bacterium]MCB9904317.1 Holliday junction branch migration protein RuvA [Planctomycetota bacterium]
MYEYLDGEVSMRAPARVVLDVAGVGYDLLVPIGAAIPASGKARVYTHLVVREDAHTLYGFGARRARDLFRLLLKVRGVGPTMALAILSGLSPDELVEAVLAGDAASLTRAKGVGKKTADQILLDLADKAAAWSVDEALTTPGASRESRGEATIEDAVGALLALGFKEKEARKNVERAATEVDSKDLEALVRVALR